MGCSQTETELEMGRAEVALKVMGWQRTVERHKISGAARLRNRFGEPMRFLPQGKKYNIILHLNTSAVVLCSGSPLSGVNLVNLQGTGSALHFAGSLSKHAATQSSLIFGADALHLQPELERWVAVPWQGFTSPCFLLSCRHLRGFKGRCAFQSLCFSNSGSRL